jgi:hypothetical protein
MNTESNATDIQANALGWTESAKEKWHQLRQRLAEKQDQASSAAFDKAWAMFELITARTDAPDRIAHPKRLLANVSEDDVAEVQALGAVRNEEGEWVVPDGLDMGNFEDWWHDVSEDLRDKTPRYMTTRHGRAIEGYVLPEDRAKGEDSEATILMYGALPIIAALSFVFGGTENIWGWSALLLLVPFLITIAQGEGVWDAAKAAGITVIAPLLMASGETLGKAVGATGGAGAMALQMGGMFGSVLIGMVLAFLAALAFSLFDDRSSVFGGAMAKFKEILKWGVVLGAAWGLSVSLLPGFLQPAFYFAVACLYPMYYIQGNRVARATKLKAHEQLVNIATSGSLSYAHIETRQKQAARAVEDTSPLFEIGTALGWQTRKQYAFAPDKGSKMVQSLLDSFMHTFSFGYTGQGKTESFLRPRFKQWVDHDCGGTLVLDGKGDLGNDLSGYIDIMISPGMSFAPMYGLSAQDVSSALKALGGNNVDEKNRIWVDGANDLIDHITTVHEALKDHEKHYCSYARKAGRLLELEIDRLILERVRLTKLGQDTAEAEAKLVVAEKNHQDWVAKANEEREWLWNIETLQRMVNLVEQVREQGGMTVPSQELLKAADMLGYAAQLERAAHHPATIHPEIGRGLQLDDSLDFLLQTWPKIHADARSSYLANVRQRLGPLSRGPKLINEHGVHWKKLEVGVDLGQVLTGARAALNLPSIIHGRAGEVVSAFAKQRIYAGVRKRAGRDWQDEGELPVLLMIDEAQLVVGQDEKDFLPIARSLGLSAVMASQGYESIEAKFGSKIEAEQFLNTFRGLVCQNSSPQTIKYMMERLGTAPMVTFKQHTVGLDMDAAVRKLAWGVSNDVHHPDRAIFKRMERGGAFRLAVFKRGFQNGGAGWNSRTVHRIDDDYVNDFIEVPQGGTREVQPVFKEEEYSMLLATQGHAIVSLHRAGAPRVDLVELNRVGAKELRKKEPEEVSA